MATSTYALQFTYEEVLRTWALAAHAHSMSRFDSHDSPWPRLVWDCRPIGGALTHLYEFVVDTSYGDLTRLGPGSGSTTA